MTVPLAALAAWSAHEFCRLAPGGAGDRMIAALGPAGAAALVVAAGAAPALAEWGGTAAALLVGLALAASALAAFRWNGEGWPLASVSVAVAAAAYAGGTLSFALFLRALPGAWAGGAAGAWEGPLLALLPLSFVWIGDSAAYAVGRKAGRRPLAPRASPGKTVEGGLAGLAAAAGAGWLAGLAFGGLPHVPLSPWSGLAAGAALGLAGQVGDLAESVFKRGAGVKDSGSLLGGHGGALDRFDGVYFAMPVAYALAMLAGPPS